MLGLGALLGLRLRRSASLAALAAATIGGGLAMGATGCASSEVVGPVKLRGEAAELTYGLDVKLGQGTMTKPSADAIRNALINAGFRVGDEKDAAVVLDVELRDVDEPQVWVVTVNGKVQKKRRVTAVMRAVTRDGKVLGQKSIQFVVKDEGEVEEEKVLPLVNHFAELKDLSSFGLEYQIDRSASKASKSKSARDESDEGEPKPKPKAKEPEPEENKSNVRE